MLYWGSFCVEKHVLWFQQQRLGVLLLLALSGGIGAVEGFLSGDDLYASCQDKNLACEAYIVGISDSVQALMTWGPITLSVDPPT